MASWGLFPAVALASSPSRSSSSLQASSKAPARPVEQAFASLVQNFAEARVGFSLRDAATGESLFDFQAGKRFCPASTQKLLTTWAALKILGPNHRFETRLGHTGRIEEGLLQGDLYVIGGGDPALGSPSFGLAGGSAPYHPDTLFNRWSRALAAAGIRAIQGRILSDATFLRQASPSPAALWEDVGNYYGGMVSGLAFHDNLYHLVFQGGRAGRKAKVLQTRPSRSGILRFHGEVLLAGAESSDSAYILGDPLGRDRFLYGSYPSGKDTFSIKGSLPCPAFTVTEELRARLAAGGLRFERPAESEASAGAKGPASEDREKDAYETQCWPGSAGAEGPRFPGTGKILDVHRGPPVWDLVRHVNQKSDNNYAEQLLCLLGREKKGKGDAATGLAVLEDFYRERAKAAPGPGFEALGRIRLKDGSGLSRFNQVSPGALSALLVLAARDSVLAKTSRPFGKTLVGAGETAQRLKRFGAGWEDRLFVKTGTLEGVTSLAGYLRADSGRLLAFALIVNDFEPPLAPHQGDINRLLAAMARSF